MEHFYKINEVAELFGIPVSTLHYWEKAGLFHIRRNNENNYRCFTLSDVLNIWEIILYRELDIPVQSIRQILVGDRDNLKCVYAQSRQQLQVQMEVLKLKMDRLSQQQALISMADQLEQLWKKGEITYSEPDCCYCYQDDFSMESMQLTLKEPYHCGIVIPVGPSNKLIRCIATSDKLEAKGRNAVWERPQEQHHYIEFLLKFELDEPKHNNLTAIYGKIQELGFIPGVVVARYLLVATENGKRIEMHRAWIEIYKRK